MNNDVFKLIYTLTLDKALGTLDCLESVVRNALLLEITLSGPFRSRLVDTDRPELIAETFLFDQYPNCRHKRYHTYDDHQEMHDTVFSISHQDEILLFSQPKREQTYIIS